MDKTGGNYNRLHLGKLEKRRHDFLQVISDYIKMSFTQLENHSHLLCGRDFANERLLVRQFGVKNS